MKLVSIAEGKAKLSEYVDECRRQPVVLTKHGHPRAALLPLDDEDDLERFLLARNPRFQDLLARSAKSGRTSLADAETQLLPRPQDSSTSQAKRSKSRKPGKRRRSA
jgi:prevent-host-death family protein